MSYLANLLIVCLISFSLCFYDSATTPVIKLDPSNFKREVLDSKDIWLIEFYAPWCGHCKAFAPEFEKAAKALKGIFKIGAVDADKEKSLAAQYQVQGFPTVKYFGSNKKTPPSDYNSARTADAVIEFMFEKAKTLANSRLHPKSHSSSTKSNNKDHSSNTHSNTKANSNTNKGDAHNDKDVIVLTDATFDDTVYKSKDMWLIAFYAPWCGHCQKLLPEWNIAATQLKGQVKLAKVDATVNTKLAGRFNVKGYPTIKIFTPGDKKSDSTAVDYEGPRESAGIVSFALEKLESFGYVPPIPQLVSQEILNETCVERNGICVIVFLPNIADSSAAERNKYLEELQELSKISRGKPIYYLWAQGGDFFDMEDKLNLAFGYPAVIAVNFSKKKYSVCHRAYNKNNLKDYISNLLMGKESLIKLPVLPKLKKVPEWDKKDYKKPEAGKGDL